MKEIEVKKFVREGYGKIAEQGSCCGGPSGSCCGGANTAREISRGIGYSADELAAVPDGSNLGLGCGNPIALASLKEGDTVLDLGSGAGFDCFLAAQKVGKTGKVIGVDMTVEMLEKARENARKGNYSNVEFRLGEIENLPVADNQIDVVISNCVINLSPDKKMVFNEVFRVLKPGGRLMVSDIALLKPLPDVVRDSIEAYVNCVAGACLKAEYLQAVKEAGLVDVEVLAEDSFSIEHMISDPKLKNAADSIVSVKVAAVKPLD